MLNICKSNEVFLETIFVRLSYSHAFRWSTTNMFVLSLFLFFGRSGKIKETDFIMPGWIKAFFLFILNLFSKAEKPQVDESISTMPKEEIAKKMSDYFKDDG